MIEQHECGHKLYAILVCSYPTVVHIHLEDADTVTQYSLHLLTSSSSSLLRVARASSTLRSLVHRFEDGVLHLARLAPCGKEIDQDQLVALVDEEFAFDNAELMHEEFAFGNTDGFQEEGVSSESDAGATLLVIIA